MRRGSIKSIKAINDQDLETGWMGLECMGAQSARNCCRFHRTNQAKSSIQLSPGLGQDNTSIPSRTKASGHEYLNMHMNPCRGPSEGER